MRKRAAYKYRADAGQLASASGALRTWPRGGDGQRRRARWWGWPREGWPARACVISSSRRRPGSVGLSCPAALRLLARALAPRPVTTTLCYSASRPPATCETRPAPQPTSGDVQRAARRCLACPQRPTFRWEASMRPR